MKNLSLCLIAITFFGCTTTTVIEYPNGDKIKVTSRNDSIVRFVKDNRPYEVDNRGNPSVISQMLEMMFIKGDWINKELED